MNKFLLALSAPLLFGVHASSQTFEGREASAKIIGAKMVEMSSQSPNPKFVIFSESSLYRKGGLNPEQVIHDLFNLSSNDQLVSYRKENDELGFTHTRYQQYYKNIPVEGGEYIAHERAGGLESINGLFLKLQNVSATPSLTEADAVKKAVAFVGAERYMWEDENELRLMHAGDPTLDFTPKGELVYYPVNGEYKVGADFRLAYKVDIYATAPLSRAYYFVDATTGDIIGRHERIHTADVEGTAATRYSGSQKIKTTQNGSSYVLQETDRLPSGIKTFNCKTTKSYSNTDFTSASTTWNLANAAKDDAALDAHWATEMMYDFLKTDFKRNSIDNAGMAMLSYVHYDKNYLNAFWDGNRMTYGDGNGTSNNNPLTSIDIGGHEVTHGVTERSARLVYQNESGALNESYSDIFGKSLEHWARPNKFSWGLGTDLGWVLRNMENPGSVSQKQPMYYKGLNWYTGTGDNGGVHYNSGVQNFWYYLIVTGKTGTNEKGQQYDIKGIGFDDAMQIVYLALTKYMSSQSVYSDARTAAMKAATDLFGDCSPQYVAVTDAWAAVGVGAKSNCAVAPTANFVASVTTSCDGKIQFTDKSSASPTSWEWDFGDGGTANIQNPAHTYTASGTYTVKLKVVNANGNNTATKAAYITVNIMTAPTVKNGKSCNPGVIDLSATTTTGTINWYDAATGGTMVGTGTTYSPNLTKTDTFYVEASTGSPAQKVGPVDASIGTASLYTNGTTHGLLFDVLAPCILKSVKVIAGAAGARTIEVQSSKDGPVIKTATVNIPAGESRVTLNFDLPVGSQYFIKISGSLVDLTRNSAGAVFPYTANGLVSITGSSGSAGYYYFFYDWEVGGGGCTSARVPVIGTIAPLAKPVITEISKNELGAPAGYTYQWYKDGVLIQGATGQTYTVPQNGDYTVEITDVATGCKAMSDPFKVATGVEEVEALSSIQIYPNPTNGILYFNSPRKDNRVEISVFSVVGEKVHSEVYNTLEQRHMMNLGSLADGIYFVRLQIGSDYSTYKFTLQH